MTRLKTISKAQENEMTISKTSETEHVRATVVENLETQSNVNFVEKMMVDSLTNVGNTCSDSEFNLEPRKRSNVCAIFCKMLIFPLEQIF
jgi:hypothetical protein